MTGDVWPQTGRAEALGRVNPVGSHRAAAQRSGVPVTSASVGQLVLEPRVVHREMRLLDSLAVPVTPGAERVGIVADGEPLLGERTEPEVVGRARFAHTGGHPAGVDCVAHHAWEERATAASIVVSNNLLSRRLFPPRRPVLVRVVRMSHRAHTYQPLAAEVHQRVRR